jgi:hypothetical protein
MGLRVSTGSLARDMSASHWWLNCSTILRAAFKDHPKVALKSFFICSIAAVQ